MRAFVRDAYGSPDVLRLEEIEPPTPADDEVKIEVVAASINPADWHMLTADVFLVRLMGMGLLRPKHRIIGADVAGRVVAVGKAVRRFAVGDEVFGTILHGGFAQYACAPASKLAHKPAEMSFEQAAALPIAGVTALQGLREEGNIAAGQRVLINGAGGGVGTFAVQLAKHFGAEVTGVCSTGKVSRVRALGADHVIDYTQEDFTRGERRYDLVFDTAAYRSVLAARRVLSPGGRYVLAGGAASRLLQLMLVRAWFRMIGRDDLRLVMADETPEALQFLIERWQAGQLEPVISGRYPMEALPDALREVGHGHTYGKLVVQIGRAPAGVQPTSIEAAQ